MKLLLASITRIFVVDLLKFTPVVLFHSPLTQTRGSMPFFWSQRPNLRYKPKPQISTETNHVRPHLSSICLSVVSIYLSVYRVYLIWLQMDGFRRHFESQVLIYGKQVILNLVNKFLHFSCGRIYQKIVAIGHKA